MAILYSNLIILKEQRVPVVPIVIASSDLNYNTLSEIITWIVQKSILSHFRKSAMCMKYLQLRST